MQFPKGHFVFLDLETTGSRAGSDRITEVGLIEVLDGEVIDQYQTLVNPETPISPFISSLTGITDPMVADAPVFAEIAEELMGRLLGRTLVAHNSRFDHSFLKNEFRRLGLDYRTRVVCTVKLSRRLTPELRSHGLDSLIHHHGLHVEARHRAMGDADLLVQLMAKWSRTLGADSVQAALEPQLRRPTLPAGLSEAAVDDLPNTPGVYLFYDEKDTLLYVGKSVKIRDRVKSHFSGDHASDRELEMCSQIARIDWRRTGGDLGAQLLEARLIKERRPIYNRQLRKTKMLWYLAVGRDSRGYLTLAPRSAASLPADDLSSVIGLFRSRRMAEECLRQACDAARLCHRLTGLEKARSGACFAHQLKRCAGACVGAEDPAAYNARLQEAFAPRRFAVWPYEGPILIREGEDYHLVDQWCHLASSRSPDTLAQHSQTRNIEYDIYKILVKFIEKGRLEILPFRQPAPVKSEA
ncbi:exonuclease domain-containing protein [Gilvimarinus sp. F26214L]|uniref:exonuclease domain-containing protein n=1 Tax=Gilvimarinus sp. DZF01 TaxID=3461371 RepID=UPI004045925D